MKSQRMRVPRTAGIDDLEGDKRTLDVLEGGEESSRLKSRMQRLFSLFSDVPQWMLNLLPTFVEQISALTRKLTLLDADSMDAVCDSFCGFLFVILKNLCHLSSDVIKEEDKESFEAAVTVDREGGVGGKERQSEKEAVVDPLLGRGQQSGRRAGADSDEEEAPPGVEDATEADDKVEEECPEHQRTTEVDQGQPEGMGQKNPEQNRKLEGKQDSMEQRPELVEEEGEGEIPELGVDERRQWRCPLCELSLPSKQGLLIHLGRKHRDSSRALPHPCPQCPSSFATKSSLREHMSNEHKPWKWKAGCGLCEICGSLNCKKKHFGLCPPEFRDRWCRKCNTLVQSVGELEEHKQRAHRVKTHVCETCGKALASKVSLRCHIESHTNDQRPCNLCGKSLRGEFSLRMHMLRHEKQRTSSVADCTCHICGQVFSNVYIVKDHIARIHEKRKKYFCELCDKGFYSQNSLKIHMQVHAGVRTFKCDQCEEAYFEGSALLQHKRKHANDRRFRCSVCGNSFLYTGSLANHIRLKHPERYKGKKATRNIM